MREHDQPRPGLDPPQKLGQRLQVDLPDLQIDVVLGVETSGGRGGPFVALVDLDLLFARRRLQIGGELRRGDAHAAPPPPPDTSVMAPLLTSSKHSISLSLLPISSTAAAESTVPFMKVFLGRISSSMMSSLILSSLGTLREIWSSRSNAVALGSGASSSL